MKYLLCIVLCLAGCGQPVPPNEIKEQHSGRLSITDDLNPRGYQHIYIIRDSLTNKEYLWVSDSQSTGLCPMESPKAESENQNVE